MEEGGEELNKQILKIIRVEEQLEQLFDLYCRN